MSICPKCQAEELSRSPDGEVTAFACCSTQYASDGRVDESAKCLRRQLAAAEDKSSRLSDTDRARFASYLRRDAASNKQLIEQMEKMPGLAAVVRVRRQEMVAELVVAEMLDNTESCSVEGEERA